MHMHMPPLGAEEPWEAHAQPPGGHDTSFLGWIIGDDVAMPMPPGAMDIPSSSSSATFQPQFAPHVQHSAHAAFTPPKLHHHTSRPLVPASPPKQAPPVLLKPKPEAAPGTEDDAATAVDQLAEAARLAEAGDVLGARETLARLNYLLPAATGATATPLLRSAFYFKEALRAALSTTEASSSSSSPVVDVLLKLGAYKAFSEVCPVLQFAHLTCVQAVLDHLGGAACIHVLDFDIGVGEQWASLMQELSRRRPGATATLKVTALVSTATHHPLELQLVHENLSAFAADARVPFHLAFFSLDAAVAADDPAELLAITAGAGGDDDAVAVHLPAGAVRAPAAPSVLRLVRRLGARLVVVSADRADDQLPFAARLFQALQSCVFLLESLDAAVVATGSHDVAAKIERFVVQPRIHRRVAERYRDRQTPTPGWRAMLAAAGFVPVQASSFAEAQAESLLNKVPVRGFRVEKRAGSLVLHWQRQELLSVTAWRC